LPNQRTQVCLASIREVVGRGNHVTCMQVVVRGWEDKGRCFLFPRQTTFNTWILVGTLVRHCKAVIFSLVVGIAILKGVCPRLMPRLYPLILPLPSQCAPGCIKCPHLGDRGWGRDQVIRTERHHLRPAGRLRPPMIMMMCCTTTWSRVRKRNDIVAEQSKRMAVGLSMSVLARK